MKSYRPLFAPAPARPPALADDGAVPDLETVDVLGGDLGNAAAQEALLGQQDVAPAQEPLPQSGRPSFAAGTLEGGDEVSADTMPASSESPAAATAPGASVAPPSDTAGPTEAAPGPAVGPAPSAQPLEAHAEPVAPLEVPRLAPAPPLLTPPLDLGNSDTSGALEHAASAGLTAFSAATTAAFTQLDGAFQAGADTLAQQTEAAEGEIRERFAGALSAGLATLAGAAGATMDAGEQSASELEGWGVEVGGRASALVQERQTQAEQLGTAHANNARQAGTDAASALEAGAEARATSAEQIGQARAASGGLPETAEARAGAATELASDTAQRIREGVGEAPDQLQQAGNEASVGFEAQAGSASATLASATPGLAGALTEQSLGAAAGARSAAIDAAQSWSDQALSLTAQLGSAEEDACATLRGQVSALLDGLTEAHAQAQERLSEAAADTVAQGNEALEKISGDQDDAEDPADGAAAGAEIAQAYEAAGAQVQAAIAEGAGLTLDQAAEAAEGLSQGPIAVDSALTSVEGELSAAADSDVSGFEASLSSQGDQVRAQGESALSGAEGELDAQIDSLEDSFDAGDAQLASDLQGQSEVAAGVADAPVASLDSRIGTAQSEIDARAQKGFLERQWDDLVAMVSSPAFWLTLVAGLVIGAVAIAAILSLPATLSAGAILAISAGIMAVAGALTGLAGTVISNAFAGKSGWDLFDGWWQNMLIGAAFGVVLFGVETLGLGVLAAAGLSAAATGALTVVSNLATGQPWDRNLLANMLLAATFVGLGRVVRNLRAPKPADPDPPPVRPTPTEKGPTNTPPEVEPEPAPRQQPRVRLGSQEDPVQLGDKTAQRSDGSFRLNRKNISNLDRIEGEPEAVVKADAEREAFAAEQAAGRTNVDKVVMGEEADALINGEGNTGKEMSADVVAVTKNGKYALTEAKGANIEHGLEQLEYSAEKLGPAQVIRYELVVPERINSPGFTVENGLLNLNGEPYLINGKPVHVTFTTQ